MNNLFSYSMQRQKTYTYGPDHKGTVVNLSGATAVDIRMEAASAGYDRIHKHTMLLGFRPRPNESITVYPGRGGQPSKDGERSYLVRSDGSRETISCIPGSGTPMHGADGVIEVTIRGELIE